MIEHTHTLFTLFCHMIVLNLFLIAVVRYEKQRQQRMEKLPDAVPWPKRHHKEPDQICEYSELFILMIG